MLRKKRDKPRRNEGRVSHGRTKPKAGAGADALEERFAKWVRSLPCLVCGKPSTFHHVTGSAYHKGRLPRSHRCGVPLCPAHHQIQHGPKESVEALGHMGFFLIHGFDLEAEGNRLWKDFTNANLPQAGQPQG